MPDNSSPFDDPLADLYGRLPDPRARDTAGGGEGAPLSRRAAREARENAASESPAAPPATEHARTPTLESAPTAEPVAAPRAEEPRPASRPAGASAARSGTLDDLFTGQRSTEEVGAMPTKKEKRRRRAGGWIALAIVVVILGGVTAGGVWAWNTYGTRIQEWVAGTSLDDYEAGQAHGEARVTIADGDTGLPVSQKLFDAGVIKTETSLYDYMIEENIAFTFQPGVYALQLEMTSPAVLEALQNPENRLANTTQLREGLTLEQSITLISEQMEMPLEELQAAVADPAAYGVAADSLEGWIFPATYEFDDGTTATDVIARMVNRTIESLDNAGVPVEDRERILTIASIIQREARFSDDFYKVSRVIQNRLDPGNSQTNGLLQMDSTAQYGYGEMHAGTASSSAEALADDNLWNTYVHPGLPVGPISNPGDLAIDAAMHPVDGPWFYFVTVNLDTGETVFTNTADEHQAAVDQWIEWCKDHPESGC